jgi:hypothetical protein
MLQNIRHLPPALLSPAMPPSKSSYALPSDSPASILREADKDIRFSEPFRSAAPQN